MAESFNIDRFMDASGKVDLSDLDWAAVPRHPLTPEAVRVVRYFATTEASTFFYARGIMATPATLREPEIPPFLSAWIYEEEFHGRAFRKFLAAYGEPLEAESRGDCFKRRTVGEHIDELGGLALSHVFPNDWPAVHMTWGTIQEFTTYMGYQCLMERVEHPILRTLCQRIMKQELRHFAFYREHARKRLAVSALARRITSKALELAWTPVGDGMSPKADVCHAIQFLFDGMEGDAVARIERRVHELPGLEWFDLFTKFVRHHQIRRAPPSWLPPPRAHETAEPLERAEA